MQGDQKEKSMAEAKHTKSEGMKECEEAAAEFVKAIKNVYEELTPDGDTEISEEVQKAVKEACTEFDNIEICDEALEVAKAVQELVEDCNDEQAVRDVLDAAKVSIY